GDETLTVTVQGRAASTVVKDTSIAQNNPPTASGNDIFKWSPQSGNAKFDGGAGIDKIEISGKRSDFYVTSSKVSSKGTFGSSADLISVERISFSDVSVAFDADGSAGKVAKLLGAIAGKDSLSNSAIVGVGLKIFDDKIFSEEDVAKILIDALLGSSHTNVDVVNLLYKNLVGVTPDPLTAALFAGLIRPGGYTEPSFAVAVADIDLNKQNIGLVGIYTDGLSFIPPPI
ncbi:MAG: hypothetical protein EBV01_15195, partial [Betaproteobacteria bacterium]|nr:hypothetical protein [Betaproteobacteria bacterium]